ncbi:MAG: DUF6526 family protein [Candidatus Sumerlaeia bacterium]|nr:DUF6526 family protein [Candidatus Sumerlaeia bacterium]
MAEPQSYENHTRLDPAFHFIGGPATLAGAMILIGSFVQRLLAGAPFLELLPALGLALLGVGSVIGFAKIRGYALLVQDRAIALEVTDRYRRLGGKEPRLLTEVLESRQVVALRFASDGELVALADRAIAEKLAPAAIKRAIKEWRPDLRRV